MPTPTHSRDSDCTVDPATDCCVECHVLHGDPCPDCEGRGFHADGCALLLYETGDRNDRHAEGC